MANSAISELPYIKVDREFCNSVAKPYQTTMLPPPNPPPQKRKQFHENQQLKLFSQKRRSQMHKNTSISDGNRETGDCSSGYSIRNLMTEGEIMLS